MNAADTTFYQKLIALGKTDYLADPAPLTEFFKFCLSVDFSKATEMWEFFASVHEQEIAANSSKAEIAGDKVFEVFYAKSAPRALRLILDNSAIKKAVLVYSPAALTGLTFDIAVRLIMAGKLEDADELLKAVAKNTAGKGLGNLMKDLLDRLLIEVMKKSAQSGKKAELHKKTSAMLLVAIGRIKGPDRAVLEQRVKELTPTQIS